MEPLGVADLPEGARVLVDSAPIIYVLEGHRRFGPRFKPLFEAHAAGRLRFAVTTISIAEVLTGPLKAGDEALARRYRAILETWEAIPLDVGIAESAGEAAGLARPQIGGRDPSGECACDRCRGACKRMIAISPGCARFGSFLDLWALDSSEQIGNTVRV